MIRNKPSGEAKGDDRIENAIGWTLRIGVLASVALVATGMAWRFAAGGANPVADELARIGLIALVATPIARVVVAGVSFGVGRDWRYVAISATVFAILLFGLLAGVAVAG